MYARQSAEADRPRQARHRELPPADPMQLPPEPVGHDSRHCGARKHQGPGTCRRPAGWGTSHAGTGRCKLHGGSTRNHRQHAARVKAEAEYAAFLAAYEQARQDWLATPVEVRQPWLTEDYWRTALSGGAGTTATSDQSHGDAVPKHRDSGE
jgi:hypothetical protein